MNFRGINSIFNSPGLKLESGSETFSKRKSTATSSNSSWCECQNFDSEKTVFVLCSSYKPPLQTFDHQKFKKGVYTPEYTVNKLEPQSVFQFDLQATLVA